MVTRTAPWRLAALGAAAFLSMVTALAAGTTPPLPLRVLIGLLMTLILPGFSVLAAAAPRLRLKVPQLALACVAVSICCDLLCGLAVGGTAIGLTATSVALGLSMVTALAASIAAIRQARASADVGAGPHLVATQSTPSTPVSDLYEGLRTGWRVVLSIFTAAAVCAIVGGSLLLSQHAAVAARGPAYLALGTRALSPPAVAVTVTSHERRSVAIRVAVLDGKIVVGTWTRIHLRPGQTWTARVKLPSPATFEIVHTGLYIGSSTIPVAGTAVRVG